MLLWTKPWWNIRLASCLIQVFSEIFAAAICHRLLFVVNKLFYILVVKAYWPKGEFMKVNLVSIVGLWYSIPGLAHNQKARVTLLWWVVNTCNTTCFEFKIVWMGGYGAWVGIGTNKLIWYILMLFVCIKSANIKNLIQHLLWNCHHGCKCTQVPSFDNRLKWCLHYRVKQRDHSIEGFKYTVIHFCGYLKQSTSVTK